MDDALVVDVDRHRALLMREARTLSEAGQIEPAVASWAFTCIADGWVDDHLHSVRDGLIELGAVADQGHLDRLLGAAMLRILGAATHLSAADALILETVIQPQCVPSRSAGDDPLGLRLLTRRYALELGLLARGDDSGPGERTPLGDTALRLPRHNLLAYLLALELLQSGGNGDHWRAPRQALGYMLEQREFEVPTTAQARRVLDPEGVFQWRRVGRLALMGLCEPLPTGDEENSFCCRYRLLPQGQEALRQVLREPPGEMVRLADVLLQEQTRQALRPLLQRSRSAEAVRRSRGEPTRSRDGGAPTATMRPAVTVPGHRAAAQRLPGPAVRRDPLPQSERRPTATPVTLKLNQTNGVGSSTRGPQAEALARELEAFYLDTEQPAPSPGSAAVSEGSEDWAAALGEPSPAQELDLQQLVGRAWEELHIQKVAFEIAGPGASLAGDRRALLQIWRELLRSAAESALLGPIDPSPWGEPTPPTVRVEFQHGPDEVAVVVHDSGPPLTAADREGILDPSLGLLTEGSRSGLMRAHRMLVSQGGALVLLPTNGGTLLRVVLPRAHRHARRAAA